MVARRWRKIFVATPGISAVANADDPHVVWAASAIADVTWVSVGNTWTVDSILCPECGAILHRAERDFHVLAKESFLVRGSHTGQVSPPC